MHPVRFNTTLTFTTLALACLASAGREDVRFIPDLNATSTEVQQCSVCAIVKVTGVPLAIQRTGLGKQSANTYDLSSLECNVLSGSGLDKNKKYLLIGDRAQFKQLDLQSTEGVCLVVGLRKSSQESLPMAPMGEVGLDRGWAKAEVQSTGFELRALQVFPTRIKNVAIGSDNCSTALLSLASTLRDSPPKTVRAVSKFLASCKVDSGAQNIEGLEGNVWLHDKLVPALKGSLAADPVATLRAFGTETQFAPEDRLQFVHAIPGLFKALNLDERYKHAMEPANVLARRLAPLRGQTARTDADDAADDVSFILDLRLPETVAPDELFALAEKCPSLAWIRIDLRILQAPSVENQRAVVKDYFNSASQDIRAHAYNAFANWYGEYSKSVAPTLDFKTMQESIPGEAGLRAYWLKKLGMDYVSP